MDILANLVYSLESIPQIIDLVVDSNKLMIFAKNGMMERFIDISLAYLVSAHGVLFNIVSAYSSTKTKIGL
jgi:hypothetical protein